MYDVNHGSQKESFWVFSSFYGSNFYLSNDSFQFLENLLLQFKLF